MHNNSHAVSFIFFFFDFCIRYSKKKYDKLEPLTNLIIETEKMFVYIETSTSTL